jgi:hypothetical protein
MRDQLLTDHASDCWVFSVSRDDDLLGGMWAVVATLFVYRDSYEESVGAEVGPHQERSGLKNGP